MFIVREIFHLQFGRYREAKKLLDEAMQKHLLLQPAGSRVLTDFTGEGYRLIIELPFESLAVYESELKKELNAADWSDWYSRFKPLVRSSEREIMKRIM
ncbi:MAG: hypothetical protein ACOVP7_00685 [Lacibacter sp.]